MAGSIKDQVAIIGLGCTKFGDNFDQSFEDLLVEAGFAAFADARIEPESNSTDTRIFLATRSSCLSVSTSTCEAETLRESPSRPNLTCRITVLCDRLCSCTSMGMANAAIKHYSFRFQMNC